MKFQCKLIRRNAAVLCHAKISDQTRAVSNPLAVFLLQNHPYRIPVLENINLMCRHSKCTVIPFSDRIFGCLHKPLCAFTGIGILLADAEHCRGCIEQPQQ